MHALLYIVAGFGLAIATVMFLNLSSDIKLGFATVTFLLSIAIFGIGMVLHNQFRASKP